MIDPLSDPHLMVMQPGLHSLVVDQGRPSSRSHGIPLGGAADRRSFQLGNALVGNPINTSALEINLVGPSLVANCPIAAVVFGADVDISTDRRPLQSGRTFKLDAGEILTLGSVRLGTRAYFCIQHGLRTPMILGSQSSQTPLRRQDRIGCYPGSIQSRFLEGFPTQPTGKLRIVWGSHADRFDRNAFVSQPWQISKLSNRMGCRLMGQPLLGPRLDLESEPVCPGTIQVTPDGQCIILGIDGQTIGGYPRIAHVIRADLDRVGQLYPGQQIQFAVVTLEEAEREDHKEREELQRILNRIELGSIWS